MKTLFFLFFFFLQGILGKWNSHYRDGVKIFSIGVYM